MRKGVFSALLFVVLVLFGSWLLSGSLPAAGPTGLSAVKATISQTCTTAGCHRPSVNPPAADLNLQTGRFPTSVINVASREDPSLKLVDTKTPERSYLLAKIKGEAGIVGDRMPLHRTPLNAQQIQEFETWVNSLKTQ